MDNIEDVILDYYKAFFALESLINDKAKGDWNKAEMLINNDYGARQVYNNVQDALKNFRRLTSDVGFVQLTADFQILYDLLKKRCEVQKPSAYLAGFLEHFRDEWEWKIEEGHIEDGDLLEALNAFFTLPNYDPDGWLRRKFLTGGLLVVEDTKKISRKTETVLRKLVSHSFMA